LVFIELLLACVRFGLLATRAGLAVDSTPRFLMSRIIRARVDPTPAGDRDVMPG